MANASDDKVQFLNHEVEKRKEFDEILTSLGLLGHLSESESVQDKLALRIIGVLNAAIEQHIKIQRKFTTVQSRLDLLSRQERNLRNAIAALTPHPHYDVDLAREEVETAKLTSQLMIPKR